MQQASGQQGSIRQADSLPMGEYYQYYQHYQYYPVLSCIISIIQYYQHYQYYPALSSIIKY